MSAGTEARDRVFGLIDGFIAEPSSGVTAIATACEHLPVEVVKDLDSVLSDGRISYRDGVLIQLGFGIAVPQLDLTLRPEGARGMAQHLGSFLAERHIKFVKDAYQNIAKNTQQLARGNFVAFDRLLHWATKASIAERLSALTMACAVVAATARPVLAMPDLNRSALTFSRTTQFLHSLLSTPSGGAYEQFIFAGLLHTLVEGHVAEQARVETKSLNASDRSSFTAGDVQIAMGSRVIEAFEVSANNWRTKISGASKTIRDNDLSRLHIVANRPEAERDLAADKLSELPEDVTVLDVRQAIEVLTAILTRPQRAEALVRIYEYLDRYQPDTARVNLLVDRLREADLVERLGD